MFGSVPSAFLFNVAYSVARIPPVHRYEMWSKIDHDLFSCRIAKLFFDHPVCVCDRHAAKLSYSHSLRRTDLEALHLCRLLTFLILHLMIRVSGLISPSFTSGYAVKMEQVV